jgi:hypothetical protein
MSLAAQPGRAHVIGERDFSGIVDLGSSVTRMGLAQKALPNTNMIVAKTLVPQLRGNIPSGETVLITAVLALDDPQRWWARGRSAAGTRHRHAEARVLQEGITVSAIEAPGQMS